MPIKEYNQKAREKIDNYIKTNNIHLDKGMGIESPGMNVRKFQIGGPLGYQLVLTRRTIKGKRSCLLEGAQDKINELERLSGINN